MYKVVYFFSALVKVGFVIPEKKKVIAISDIITDFQLVLAEKVKRGQKEVSVPDTRKVSDRSVLSAAERENVVFQQLKEFRVADFCLVHIEENVVPD